MIATVATVPLPASSSPETGHHVARSATRRPAVGGTAAVHRGPGHWLVLARTGPSCRLPGPLAEARIPARAPPSLISIVVITPVIYLDSMVLHIISAGRWELRMLRSVGQLGPMLDSFTVFVARAVIGLRRLAPPLHHPRFPLRPALSIHRGSQWRRDGAVALRQATPPSVGLRRTPSARSTGPSPSDCTAPSTSIGLGQLAATKASGTPTAALLIHGATDARRRPVLPAARAVTMLLHNHGDIGRRVPTAWAWAWTAEEGGDAEELEDTSQG